MTGVKLACHSMPMFHGMGIAQTGWAVSFSSSYSMSLTECSPETMCGLVVTAFKPQSPAVSLTPDLVIQGAINTASDVMFCVPSFVEVRESGPLPLLVIHI